MQEARDVPIQQTRLGTVGMGTAMGLGTRMGVARALASRVFGSALPDPGAIALRPPMVSSRRLRRMVVVSRAGCPPLGSWGLTDLSCLGRLGC